MSQKKELEILSLALEQLQAGFEHLPQYEAESDDLPKLERVLKDVAIRLTDNDPYFHPLYAGQMLKPPHPAARLAYALSMWINPNNHAMEGGRASANMEKEAVAQLSEMFGWKTHLGHLTGGGTIANMEALWIASKLHPGKAIAASDNAHYTHKRMCDILDIPFVSIPCDTNMRMHIPALKQALNNHDIGTVVATMGTTLCGSVDPLTEILSLGTERKFRVHADAAYGGYYVLARHSLNKQTALSFEHLDEVDSLVIDPHKHGLLPYGCGCVLFKDVSVAAFYKHQSPYTYLCSPETHLGEISLECSRPGAAAAALWAMQRFFPLVQDGDFARNLSKSRQAAQILSKRLAEDKKFMPLFEPDLDIVLWTVRNSKASLCSTLNEELRQRAAAQNLYLVVAKVPTHIVAEIAQQNGIQFESDTDEITCLRSCLMKADHLDWLDKIWQILSQTTTDILSKRIGYG